MSKASRKAVRGPGRPKKEVCIDPLQNTEINMNLSNIVPVIHAKYGEVEYQDFSNEKSIEFNLTDEACTSFENLWDFLCKINPVQTFVFDRTGIHSIIDCPEIESVIFFKIFANQLNSYKIKEKIYIKFDVNKLRLVVKTIKKDKMIQFSVNSKATNIMLTIFDEIRDGVPYNTQTYYVNTRICVPEEYPQYDEPYDYDGIICVKNHLLEKNLENTRQIFGKVELHCTNTGLEIYGISAENDTADNVSGFGNIDPHDTVMVFLKRPEESIDKRFMIECLIKYTKNIKCSEITKFYFGQESQFCIEYDIKSLGTLQIFIPEL